MGKKNLPKSFKKLDKKCKFKDQNIRIKSTSCHHGLICRSSSFFADTKISLVPPAVRAFTARRPAGLRPRGSGSRGKGIGGASDDGEDRARVRTGGRDSDLVEEEGVQGHQQAPGGEAPPLRRRLQLHRLPLLQCLRHRRRQPGTPQALSFMCFVSPRAIYSSLAKLGFSWHFYWSIEFG